MNLDTSENLTGDPIVAFYLGKSTDTSGRRIENIWMWDNSKLEQVHDYIQWLFPLCERSRFNRMAPILSVKTIDAFRKNDELKKRLVTSLDVMLRFYGLKSKYSVDGSMNISRASDFDERKSIWLNRRNHNFLRITRILKSLRILGLSNVAYAFFACLEEIYFTHSSEIGAETYAYWNEAIKQ